MPDDVERGRARDRRHGLGRKRIAHQPAGDAGARRDLLLEVEIGHLVVGDRGQAAIVGHHVAAGRRPAQRFRGPEGVARLLRRAMRMDVDDRQQGGSERDVFRHHISFGRMAINVFFCPPIGSQPRHARGLPH
jgi:hypothetical protein